jgi:hypothetical protein
MQKKTVPNIDIKIKKTYDEIMIFQNIYILYKNKQQ